jgi:hypothetical protein
MNNADVLKTIIAGILDLVGVEPQSQLPESNRFDVKGQTTTTNKKGNLRRFDTKGSRNLAPTTEPIKQGARSPMPVRATLSPSSPGQMSLNIELPEAGPKEAPRALPSAGQSGGSMPPKGTQVPGTTRDTFQQSKRSKAAGRNVRPSQSTVRTGYGANAKGGAKTPPAGAADVAEARLKNLQARLNKLGIRGGAGIGDILNIAGAGYSAYDNYNTARGEGFSQTDSIVQGLAGWTGTMQGGKIGAMAPGKLKIPGTLLGALIGNEALTNLVRTIQGGAPEKAGPKPATPKEQADAAVIRQMRQQLATGKTEKPEGNLVKGKFPQSQNTTTPTRQDPVNRRRLVGMPYNPWYD